MLFFFRSRLRLAVILTLFLFCCIWLFISSLPKPMTRIHLTAKTKTVAYSVSNPEMVKIELREVRLNIPDKNEIHFGDDTTVCVTGELRPAENSILRYTRSSDEVITIEIDEIDEVSKSSVFIAMEAPSLNGGAKKKSFKKEYRLENATTIVIHPKDKECRSVVPDALPIWGPAEIGDEGLESSPPTSGEIKVYARSIKEDSAALYQAGEFVIPSLSRISEQKNDIVFNGEDWFGSVTIPKDKDEKGFKVQATTNAKSLRIYQPGREQEGYDIIEVSRFDRQFKDPAIQWVQMWVAIFVITAEICFMFVEFISNEFFRKKRNKCNDTEKKCVPTDHKEAQLPDIDEPIP